MRVIKISTYIFAACFSLTSLLFAQAPTLINYQGKISMTGMAVEDSTNMTFIIYNDSIAINQAVWSKEYENVRLSAGVFKVLLGPFPPEIFNGSGERWLEVNVGSQRLLPRYRLVSVPYAIHSNSARTLSAADGDPLDAVVVDADGKVGIGTTNPETKLHVVGGTDVALRVASTGSESEVAAFQIKKNDVSWAMGTGGPATHYGGEGGMGFRQSIGSSTHITRMVIDSAGNVGIGTSAPETKLDVDGVINARNSRPIREQMVHRRILFGVAGDTTISYGSDWHLVRPLYGPFGYAIPTLQSGATRKYRLYAIYADYMTNDGVNEVLFDMNNEQDVLFTLPRTWGGPPSNRDAFSDWTSSAPDGHGSIKIRTTIPGKSGTLYYLELQTWDFF